MNKIFSFIVLATLSGTALAADIENSPGISSIDKNGEPGKNSESILDNAELKRLHREMTFPGISEAGMEARVQMMSREGKAYHQALEQQEKNTAG